MYKIGEFSKITSLSVKTLRYYDEEKLLVPSERDESSGYRLYSETDCERAQLISLLRTFDFSIAEIREVLEHYEDSGDLSYYLAEKKAQLVGRVANYRKLIKSIDSFVSSKERRNNIMQYEIETKAIPAFSAATIRFKGRYADCGKYIGQLFSEVKGNAAGAPFNCYYDGEYKDEDADIEVCVPVKSNVEGNGVTTKKFPEIKAISTLHKGPYDQLSGAYKALTDYANEHGLTMKTPCREIYLKGPGMVFKGNPDHYETEIIIEIE